METTVPAKTSSLFRNWHITSGWGSVQYPKLGELESSNAQAKRESLGTRKKINRPRWFALISCILEQLAVGSSSSKVGCVQGPDLSAYRTSGSQDPDARWARSLRISELVGARDVDHGRCVGGLRVDVDEAVGSDGDSSGRIDIAGLRVTQGVKLNFGDAQRIVGGANVLRFFVFGKDVFRDEENTFAAGKVLSIGSVNFSTALAGNVDISLAHRAQKSHALVRTVLSEDLFELSFFGVGGPGCDLDADRGAAAGLRDRWNDCGGVNNPLLGSGGIR